MNIADVNSHEIKENALNEKVSSSFWPVLYILLASQCTKSVTDGTSSGALCAHNEE